MTNVLDRANKMAVHLTELYREFHRHSETAHHEIETNRRIQTELERLGVPYLAPSDIITIAVIEGEKSGAAVGIRCDTDVLTVTERTGLPYASENPGVLRTRCPYYRRTGLCRHSE